MCVSEGRSIVSNSLWSHDCSLSGSSVYGILQARILEWVVIPFSRESSWPKDWTQISYIAGRFFTIWITWGAHKAGLLVTNSLIFSLSEKVFVLHLWRIILGGYRILGWWFFFFPQHFKHYTHSLLPRMVSQEKSAIIFIFAPLYVRCFSPLISFKIFLYF